MYKLMVIQLIRNSKKLRKKFILLSQCDAKVILSFWKLKFVSHNHLLEHKLQFTSTCTIKMR